ncbi:MAG: replication-relaxation family protein [Candidatus Humimicrobiaceae bacterium]
MVKSEKTRLPRYRKAKTPPPMRLTDRDKRIVEAVYQLRFLTRDQIKLLEFGEGSMTACQRGLSLLYHNGYLSAVHKPIPTGYGSSKRVYCLSKKGAGLIAHLYSEEEAREIKWNEKLNKVEPFFIEHTLAINDVKIAFLKAVLETKEYELFWFNEQEVKAWKEKVDDPENSGKTLPITPDAFLYLIGKNKKAYYFLEVDRATESNCRWRDKIKGYVEYVKSGKYQAKFKTEALRVLTISTSKERIANLIKTTQSVENAYFFLFATFEQIKDKNNIFKPVWKTTKKEDLISLL